jgi:hypothetical protein
MKESSIKSDPEREHRNAGCTGGGGGGGRKCGKPHRKRDCTEYDPNKSKCGKIEDHNDAHECEACLEPF